jgi:hypothetical protein
MAALTLGVRKRSGAYSWINSQRSTYFSVHAIRLDKQ